MKHELRHINKKVNIILLLTPFHITQLNKVKNEIITSSDTNIIFFKEKFVNIELLLLENTIPKNVPADSFYFYEILKNPFKIFHYRRIIGHLKSYFKNELSELKGLAECNLIVFSFHGILPQVLRSELKLYDPTIIEIEEGLSYYYRYTWIDKLFSFLYAVFTPALLNYKLEYRGNLGKNKGTKILYARFPELLPNKISRIEYRKIKSYKSQHRTKHGISRKILILTSPFSEYKLLSSKKEHKILTKILRIAKLEGYRIYVKCHPSENSQKYTSILNDVIILDHKTAAERINYFEYNKIIHFGSSVIIDLFERNFDKKNIISIKLVSFSNNLKLFLNQTYTIKFNKDFDDSLRKALNEG